MDGDNQRYFRHMRPPDQRADQLYEGRDQELGNALRSWNQMNASLLPIALEGPLDSAGMDPTWLLRMSGESLDAEVCLFYGPRVDVAASCRSSQPPGCMSGVKTALPNSGSSRSSTSSHGSTAGALCLHGYARSNFDRQRNGHHRRLDEHI